MTTQEFNFAIICGGIVLILLFGVALGIRETIRKKKEESLSV